MTISLSLRAGLLTAALALSSAAAAPAATASGPSAVAAPRIASYNVFMLARSLYPNWGQLTRADLIDRERVLDGQDVVVLQELFDNEAGNRLLANLKDTYPNQTPVVGRSRSGWDQTLGEYSGAAPEDGGTAIVSRWPIVRKIQHIYTEACGVEEFSNKGFAYVELRSPDGPVHVIGTHAQATDSTCDLAPAEVRSIQFGEIADFIAARGIPASQPLYVVGDLNVDRYTPEYADMLDRLDAVGPTHTGHSHSWDCDDNSVCRDQYGTGWRSEHLDYVLPIAGHPAPATYVNETRRVKSSVWKVTSWWTTYSYNDYSDHYPVFGYAS
ncbi:sphingomyelin phosphodiesterase [Nocardioides speluncae]|uniref:sphingomyelin phosphodiesterase n=1 Tax=Nocardioides speluncae TaxID=2670337 RepID=UPI000D68FFC1|nr:sphingomyelin phosphodiesterase [Nocardioides speluncae]